MTERLHERQHETADARVDVASDPVLGRQRREFDHGIHHAVGIGVGRGHDDAGVLGHEPLSRRDVDPIATVQGHPDVVHVEVVGSLGVRRVGRERGEYLRTLDAPGPGALAAHQHRHEDRLGSSRRHRPAVKLRGRSVHEVARHGDDLLLDPRQRGEPQGVERVREEEPIVDVVDERLEFGVAGRVHQPEEPPAMNLWILLAKELQFAQNLGGRA